jgi:hypothetical protein
VPVHIFLSHQTDPRWLSVWGLVAAVPYLANYLLHFFDIDPGLPFLVLPLAVQEMVMGLWLIIKGFSLDAVKELDGARPLAPQSADSSCAESSVS